MELYGHLLSHSRDLRLAEQVQDILRAEIYAGRWAVGERLPSIADLAKQTGLSIDPIQRALKGLKEEGYLTLEARKGAFLKATVPVGAAPLGTIGILIEDDAEETLLGATIRTEAFGRWRLQTLLSVLQQCNWDARVVTLKKEETLAEVNGPNWPLWGGGKRHHRHASLPSFPDV